MWTEKEVFEIILTITQNLGLQSNIWANSYRFKRFSLFFLFHGVSWLLMVAKLIFQSDEIDLGKLIVIVSTSLHVIRVTYFVVKKAKILNLHDEVNEILNAEKSKIHKIAAEQRLRKIFIFLVVFLSLVFVATFISYVFEDESELVLYKPKLLNYSGFTRFIYIIYQCGFAFLGYASVWSFNLIVTHFMIYVQEASKFVGSEFEAMKTNKDLKACVELHLNFKK